MLLTPGASADRNQPALVALDKALSADGLVVERIDLNSRQRPAAVVEVVRKAAGDLAERAGVDPGRVVLGGRSFGGRMCSMAVADGLPALGLVLISYPLHPPGRPEKLRTEHFPALRVPCLFVSGTKDAFGSPQELEAATASIPGAVEHAWIEGADHGLRKGGPIATDAVRRWANTLISPFASSKP